MRLHDNLCTAQRANTRRVRITARVGAAASGSPWNPASTGLLAVEVA
jgi:hypothetical protein